MNKIQLVLLSCWIGCGWMEELRERCDFSGWTDEHRLAFRRWRFTILSRKRKFSSILLFCVCGCLSCGFDLALVAALREWIAKFRLPPEGDFLEWRRSCTTPPRLFLPSPPGLLSSSYLPPQSTKKN